MNTTSNRVVSLAALLAASLLCACSFDQVRGAFSPTPEKTVIAAPKAASQPVKATVYLNSTTPEVTRALGPALTSGRYVLTTDPTLAIFHVTTTPIQSVGEESTSAPLMGILRKSTRTETFEIPFTVKDAAGKTLHSGNVVGFGNEDSGVYPRAASTSTASNTKARDDAIAQLPEALLETLNALPWQATVIGAQDTKTVMLGFDAWTGVTVGQRLTVVGQPDTILKVTGFGPYGRALAVAEKGTLPLPGQMVTLK